MDKTRHKRNRTGGAPKRGRILKQIGWGVLAFVIIAHVRVFTTLILHPFGGYEYHHIFAYSGGTVHVALRVLAEYILSTSVAASILVLLRYPGNWRVLAALASCIVWQSWWGICLFPHQTATFRYMCFALLPVAGFVPIGLVFAAHLLSDRIRRPKPHQPDRRDTPILGSDWLH